MNKSGSGGRTDWKAKIDQSTWIDGTQWTESDDSTAESGVEFLETEPSAFRLSKPTEEVSESLLTSSTSRLVALGAAGVVLVALAIMSRPGNEDAAFEQLPTADQQEILERRAQGEGLGGTNNDTLGTDPARERDDLDETDTAADPTGERDEAGEGDGAGTATTVAPPPIPGLRADLPTDLEGILYITGSDGSLVSVDWAGGEATELRFPTEVTMADGETPVLQQNGAEVIVAAGDSLIQLTRAGLESSQADIVELLPTSGGLAVIARGADGPMAFLLPAPGREPPESVVERTVSGDLDPVGRWNDQLVVQKAANLWLLDVEGDGGRFLTDGQLLSFDGQRLVTFACLRPTECQIGVGTPDAPEAVTVPVPEPLAARDASAWGPSTTVSNDGRSMAIVDDTGAFSAPIVVDLETAEVTVGTDIVNGDSPLEWSPDGRFLTYAFGDDLVLWDLLQGERYRIDIDRQIGQLLWAPAVAESDG